MQEIAVQSADPESDVAVATAARDSRRGVLVAKARGKGPHATIRVGDVTVVVPRPSAASVKHNVAMSSEALERATKRLVRAGVRLYPKKNVPLYSVDPDRPGVFIRRLNGRVDRGVLEDGVFKVTG